MKQKTIVFTEAYKAELLEVEIPVPGPGQVRVKLAVSTISSGTERANLVGDVNVSISRDASPVPIFPRRSGYSSAGVVDMVGEGVTEFKVGDRVAMSWTLHTQYICKNVNEVYSWMMKPASRKQPCGILPRSLWQPFGNAVWKWVKVPSSWAWVSWA